jgi:predicted  nucleic acid-binding Zn-ribbon protein
MLMIRLQKIYDNVAEAIRERRTAPPEVQELQEQNRVRQLELERLEEDIDKHQQELQEVLHKQKEWEVELEHFQRQKGMVTNEREFTAVINEIDYATRALEEAAERRKEIEEHLEQTGQDIAARRDARPEEEAAHKEVVSSWEARKKELEDLVHELAGQAKEIEADLQPPHRARFLRLLRSKHGTAMAAATEGTCALCHYSIRPHLQQRVRRAAELITCEHCHRILFLPEETEEE